MIPFRKQRLATSVVNRIFNVYDGLPPRPQAGPPAAPDPSPEGQALDERLAPKPGVVDADPQTAETIAIGPLV